jgi:hypothetical protein
MTKKSSAGATDDHRQQAFFLHSTEDTASTVRCKFILLEEIKSCLQLIVFRDKVRFLHCLTLLRVTTATVWVAHLIRDSKARPGTKVTEVRSWIIEEEP